MTQDWGCHFPVPTSSLSQLGVCGLSVLLTPRTFITYLPPAYVSLRNAYRRPRPRSSRACSSPCPSFSSLSLSSFFRRLNVDVRSTALMHARQFWVQFSSKQQEVFVEKVVTFREIRHNGRTIEKEDC